MSARDIEAIRARAAAATPGPWEWFGYSHKHTKDIYLATQKMGRRFVMAFERWGMSGAQPLFQSDNLLRTIPELVQRGEILTNRGGCITSVRQPDAVFIAHARADVDTLLEEIDALRAEIRATTERAA